VIPARLARLAALCAAVAITPLAHAKGSDELWEMTFKMEMEGMPMSMPAQTSKVCMEAGKAESAVPKGDSDCRMSNVKHSGSKTSFRMDCTQPEKMTGTGEITRTRDRMSGTISLKGDETNMKQTFSGRRVGSCDAKTHTQAQFKEMKAQQMNPVAAQYRQACAEGVEKLDPTIFDEKPFMAEGMSEQDKAEIRDMVSCDKVKPKFCAKAKEAGSTMRTAKGNARARAKYAKLEQALRLCRVDIAPIQAAACKDGVRSRDWQFVSDQCPAEAKDVAAANCVGRDYTEVMSKTPEEFRNLCSRHAPQRGMAAAPRSAPAETKAGEESATGSAIKEGTNVLRKFLKF
jgi:hypothetical protein